MFSLKKENLSRNCDEFGWWLTLSESKSSISDSLSDGDFESAESSSSSPPSMSSETSTFAEEFPLRRIRRKKYSRGHKNATDVTILCGEAKECGEKTTARSYTPERLVRDREYQILLPSSPDTKNATKLTSPRTNREDLSRLIDRKRVGASQLEAVLATNPINIRLPVAVSRGKLRIFSGKKSAKSFGDLLSLANRESPRKLATPKLISSGSSCESLSNQKPPNDSFKEMSMRLETLDNESVLIDELSSNGIGSLDNFFSDDFRTEATEDPESIVRELRGKIEHLQNRNKEMFGEICSLRKNFQWEERKTGNLTTETAKLRREIQDLRYIDDLVNLLRGQLEEISQRRWPFKIGLSEHTEEVNLVI